MSRPGVTVAIPSSGERRSLLETVASVLRDGPFPFEVEVLIVWSGLSEPPIWSELLPDEVRQRLEALGGLSRAKNAALRWARGELVAFTEDDALCSPGWLPTLYDAWQDGGVVVGGPVKVVWPRGRPRWANSNAEALLGFCPEKEEFDLSSDQMLVGGNMAVDRIRALHLGGFDERLGHGAGTGLMGEETEFISRAHRAGVQVRYLPTALVDHCIEERAATRRSHVRRMFLFGRTLTVLQYLPKRHSTARRFLRGIALIGGCAFSRQPTQRVAEASFLFGSIVGLRDRSRLGFIGGP